MKIAKLTDIPIEKQFMLLGATQDIHYADKAYIRADGAFFFHEGKPHSIKQPLNRTIPVEAQMILAGERYKVIKQEGLYIGANPKQPDPNKRMILTISFAEIQADMKRIYTEYIPFLKSKKRDKNLRGQAAPDIDAQLDALESELKKMDESDADNEAEETAEQRTADLKKIGIEADADGKYTVENPPKPTVTYGPELLTIAEKDFKKALKALQTAVEAKKAK
jgi:hypothetical protein